MELVYGPVRSGPYYERVYRREDGLYFLTSQDLRYCSPEGESEVGAGAELLDDDPILPLRLAAGLCSYGATLEDYKRVFRPESLALFYYYFGPKKALVARLEVKPLYTPVYMQWSMILKE